MLCLSRRTQQSIRIGKDITVVLIDAQRGKARIGVIAPKDVPVHRSEVFAEIERQKRKDGAG